MASTPEEVLTVSDAGWINPPAESAEAGEVLRVVTGERTDFWRRTFYGFERDSGHLRAFAVQGDFSAEVRVRGRYTTLYDQAGLMIRLDARHWIKAGIEFSDGVQNVSTVVTREWSDWSLTPLGGNPAESRFRVTRLGEAVRVDYAIGEQAWRMVRLAHLPGGGEAMVGPMCCSPERAGFEVEFAGFRIGPVQARSLHE